MNPNWNTDRRLDILVLGPMGEDENPAASTAPIRDAIGALLGEPEFEELLARAHIGKNDRFVHIPDGFNDQEIVNSVLSHLDMADLVVFNFTPKTGKTETSPNVFYELALVHSLGIPAIVIVAGDKKIPFYASTTNQHRVKDFLPSTLMDALRVPLREFIDFEHRETNLTDNRVTQFYRMPVVDISAAVGLATGYYHNFLSRLITEGGFLALYPDLIRQVIVVRPSGVDSTYPADMELLKEGLTQAGHKLETAKNLAPPPNDPLGQLWFDHVKGIVLDIPRTIYPLQRSPRLLSLLGRMQSLPSAKAQRSYEQRWHQVGEHLLDRVEAGIRYQLNFDAQRVRSNILHFSTISKAPVLVKELLA